jgi:Pvc16 N-terminal domain
MALTNTSQAIGAVTRLIVDHVNRRTALPVNVGRPEDSSNVTISTLNVFLYETLFDPSLKNYALVDGQSPPLWLILKYLLTGFDATGNSDTADAHDVLGQGAAALQELAFLGLDAAVAGGVRGALEDNPEQLKVTFDECNVDLVNKITQASDDEYRLSLAFQVRPVMVVPRDKPSFNLLVGVNYTTTPISLSADPVGLDVLASLGPRIAAVTPAKFAIGDEFEITGEDLHLSNLECRLGPMELGIVAQWPDRLRVRVETLLQSGTYLSAGEHPLVIKQYLPATGRYRRSNTLVGGLLPTITGAMTGPIAVDAGNHVSTTITINGFLLGRNEDAILVALYRNGVVAHLFDIVKPVPLASDPPDNQQQLQLNIVTSAEVLPHSYQLIVVINGQQARQSPAVALTP